MSEKRRHILNSEVEGKPAFCLDTGLEPRSFARTKMSQSMVEKGYIVKPNGSHEVWMSTGVCEFGGHMRVWGKPFSGYRLDDIINQAGSSNESQKQNAIQAIIFWIKAKMNLGDIFTTLNPAATFIDSGGNVFFTPPNLSNKCLIVEGMEINYYICPDLVGIEAVAFCAAAMLYKVFTKTLPFTEKLSMFQDMREGIFLPPHLSAPGLNKELSNLIQSALYLPVEKKRTSKNQYKDAIEIISKMLDILANQGKKAVPVSSLLVKLSKEENRKEEKQKKRYLFKKNVVVKGRRFVVRNRMFFLVFSISLAVGLFLLFSTIDNYQQRPTTENMLSTHVIYTYYNAYSSLDHVLMEVCANDSDPVVKSDLNSAIFYFAAVKSRQAYDYSSNTLIPARAWKEEGRELPAPNVFGVTDITLELLTGSEEGNAVVYRANYLLWAPDEQARIRTDTITLQRDRRNNWQITEIIRSER